MAFIKQNTHQIGQFTVTLDKEDLQRVAEREWKPIEIDQRRITFVTDLGTQGRPAFQLLSGFILGVQPDVYVTLKDVSERELFDYRKKNLEQYRQPNPIYKP